MSGIFTPYESMQPGPGFQPYQSCCTSDENKQEWYAEGINNSRHKDGALFSYHIAIAFTTLAVRRYRKTA